LTAAGWAILLGFGHERAGLGKSVVPSRMPQQEQIIAALRQIAQAIDTYSRQLLTEHGLSAPQIGTMRAIAKTGSSTPSELAEALHLSPQTMAGILQRLEQRGMIQRERDTSDRRSFVVRLTDEGRKAEAKAPQLLRDEFMVQLQKLPVWEQTTMLATLQRIAHMMHADDLDAVPFFGTGDEEQPRE
jgi:DNA-binding MarR family transcriptional regulator